MADMHTFKNTILSILAACLGLLGIFILLSLIASGPGNPAVSALAGSDNMLAGYQTTQNVTPTVTPTPVSSLYMPLMRVYKTPEVTMLKAWSSETLDGKLQAFLPNSPMIYQSSGTNNLGQPAKIGLRWQQSGPCASGQIFSSTLTIPPGDWSHFFPGIAPSCTGVFTATASMVYTDSNTTLAPRFVVNNPGTVRVNLQQGFDKCSHPEIEDMQVWWDKSPYVVFNLYLGGISYACKNNPLDAVYVRQLAEQGWWFIPTWVGPQAPCSKYLHKMSSDRDEAYLEGRQEAINAYQTAESLGLFGEKVIYYDLESYTGDDKCRNTVKAFIRGWTEELKERDSKAGAYGAACRSYIADWAQNVPPPDDIWIAHWYLDSYDPDATVWDAVCLDDPAIYWLHNQRIRQYAGGHSETWGGVPLVIDSNVLEGEVTYLPVSGQESAKALYGAQVEITSPVLRDLQFLDTARGWVLADNRLLWTDDGGGSWQDIAPAMVSGGRILDVNFTNAETGWMVGMPGGDPALAVWRTMDGGREWLTSGLPLDPLDAIEIKSAYLEMLEGEQAFVALKLQSGSSFSRGRLFYTRDGGLSWEERALPLGEPTVFIDSSTGWVAGGPAGDQLYRTDDGGYTWQVQELDFPEQALVEVGLPRFSSNLDGWLPVVVDEGGKARLEIFASLDGGETWRGETRNTYSQRSSLGLLANPMPGTPAEIQAWMQTIPAGAIAADFDGGQSIWLIIQSGGCQEDEGGDLPAPVRCVQDWRLERSDDGGRSWEIITVDLEQGS